MTIALPLAIWPSISLRLKTLAFRCACASMIAVYWDAEHTKTGKISPTMTGRKSSGVF